MSTRFLLIPPVVGTNPEIWRELLQVLKKGSDPHEEKSDLHEEKKNLHEEKKNPQEEKNEPAGRKSEPTA